MASALDESALAEMVALVVAGDFRIFEALLTAKPTGINGLLKSDANFTVFAGAVRCVLLALRQREVSPETAQLWASFVRRGYFGHSVGPITPLNIGYDEQDEDSIAHTVGRIDELGDSIDGEISDEEMAELLQSLETPGAGGAG